MAEPFRMQGHPASGGEMTTNLDIDLLRTFATIADQKSFTRAAERLGRTQSTVSLQVKRLEEALGTVLFERNARRLALTAEGELLLPSVRRMLKINDEIVSRLTEPEIEGEVRLGTPEDFATMHLPGVLARFAEAHPRVALTVTCDLTLNLVDRFAGGEFDLVLVKREPIGSSEGVRVWTEPLVWAAAHEDVLEPGKKLPLVVSPAPCVYRKRATMALDAAGLPWRIAYTSPSLAGTQAALKAGLGLTVLPKEMVPAGLAVLDETDGLPRLPDTEIALLTAPGPRSRAATRLAEHIVQSLEKAGS